VGREIRPSNIGYYRFTITGMLDGDGDLEIKLSHATRETSANPTTIHIEIVANRRYFNFVSILRTEKEQERVFISIVVNEPASAAGSILVEVIK
jgi:hypothetical protein